MNRKEKNRRKLSTKEALERAETELHELTEQLSSEKTTDRCSEAYGHVISSDIVVVTTALSKMFSMLKNGARYEELGMEDFKTQNVVDVNQILDDEVAPHFHAIERHVPAEKVSFYDEARCAAMDLMGNEGPFGRQSAATINNAQVLFDNKTDVRHPDFPYDQISTFRAGVKFLKVLLESSCTSRRDK